MSDDMLSLLSEIHQKVGQIDGKLDAVVARQDRHEDDDAKVGERVRKIENSRMFERGIAAAAGAVVSFAVSFLKGH